jgi:hypothetical protein
VYEAHERQKSLSFESQASMGAEQLPLPICLFLNPDWPRRMEDQLANPE